jgi:hypothetical protein
MRYLAIILIAVCVYLQGIKPVISDRYYLLHKQGDKTALQQALAWNPNSSLLQIESGDLLKVIYTHNGDLTEYSLWYLVGLDMLRRGDPNGVAAIHRSLWLYPNFDAANDTMQQIQKGKK